MHAITLPTFLLQAFNLYNIVNPDDAVVLGDMEDVEDFMTMMAAKGMGWEIICYLATIGAIKMFPECRSMGDSISMRNPLQGTVFWFLAGDFLAYSVEHYNFDIPGLSKTDGNEQDHTLSSLETVKALATSKITALTAICVEQDVLVPDYSQLFFQLHDTENVGPDEPNDDEQADDAGSDGNEDSDEDGLEDSEAEDENVLPKNKKAKRAATTGRMGTV